MFRWESPGGTQTHESVAETLRTINRALRNMRPGWFHTHINLWGPSDLPAGVVPLQYPLPSGGVRGSPRPEQRSPASIGAQIMCVCVLTVWVRISLLLGQGHPRLPRWGASPEVAKQLMKKLIEENKSIEITETVTERDAEVLFLRLVDCCTTMW